MADPTLDELRALDDPGRYTKKEGVPIWVPHVRQKVNPDGTAETIDVRETDLQAYADDINRRESERGVVGRITDGHVKTGQPMPKLLGYYRRARVGRFGPQRVPAVLVDCYYRNECMGIVRERPYRSPEAYTKAKSITGLALLLTDPFLDMGTVTTYEVVARPVCYGDEHMPGSAMGAANGGTPEQVGKDAPAAPPEKGAEKPGEKKKPEDFKPEEKELFEKTLRYMRQCYGLDEEWPKTKKTEAPEQKPGVGGKDEQTDPGMKKPEEVTAMEKGKTPEQYEKQFADLRTDYEKLSAALAAEKARNDGLALEREQERCLSLVKTGLVGYSLSEAETTKEVGKLLAMKAEDRPERVKELKAIYAERLVPGGSPIQLYTGPVEGQDLPDSPTKEPWYHQAALQYMRSHLGTQYEAACEVIQANAKK